MSNPDRSQRPSPAASTRAADRPRAQTAAFASTGAGVKSAAFASTGAGVKSAAFAIGLLVLALASAPGRAGAPEPAPRDDAPIASPTRAAGAPVRPDARTPDVAPSSAPRDGGAPAATRRVVRAPRPVLDPSARLVRDDEGTESWTLFLDLESGHRITQLFLLTNAGPGEHTAVAVGHLAEPGREPYRYVNGRRRSRWTLSDDRLYFDIAASHLDLHRPTGELRITKDDIEIRMRFDFAADAPSAVLPDARRPPDHRLELLAVGARVEGTIHAPWMNAALATRGRLWLVHSWSERAAEDMFVRRDEVFAARGETAFYGLHLVGERDWESAWSVVATPWGEVIESGINVEERWRERPAGSRGDYAPPEGFDVAQGPRTGSITLGREWLRFDPLEVIPQPFRWFIRRRSNPREVWADVRIGGSLLFAPVPPSLPTAGETTSARRVTESSRGPSAPRESEDETASSSVTGVASITFLNPMDSR